MDPFLIPIVAVAVGVPGLVAFVAVLTGHTRKMKELAIRDREIGADADLGPTLDALRDDLDDTRSQLVDVQERLDFTERLLAAPEAGQEDGN